SACYCRLEGASTRTPSSWIVMVRRTSSLRTTPTGKGREQSPTWPWMRKVRAASLKQHWMRIFIFLIRTSLFTMARFICCPRQRKIAPSQVYRAVEFPRQWILDRVLMRDIDAVDSSLIRYEGRYWLFTSGLQSKGEHFDGDCQL